MHSHNHTTVAAKDYATETSGGMWANVNSLLTTLDGVVSSFTLLPALVAPKQTPHAGPRAVLDKKRKRYRSISSWREMKPVRIYCDSLHQRKVVFHHFTSLCRP